MACATHPGTSAVAACTRCDRPICDDCRKALDGRPYCASCVAELEAKLAAPPAAPAAPATPAASVEAAPLVPEAGPSPNAVAYTVAAGIVGALAWYGITEITSMKLGLVAIGVGWLVGRAAVLGAGGGGKSLALVSLAVGVSAMALGEYLILNHEVRAFLSEQNPDASLAWFLSPAKLFPIYTDSFGVLDAVFYAIGAWEAWRQPAKPQA